MLIAYKTFITVFGRTKPFLTETLVFAGAIIKNFFIFFHRIKLVRYERIPKNLETQMNSKREDKLVQTPLNAHCILFCFKFKKVFIFAVLFTGFQIESHIRKNKINCILICSHKISIFIYILCCLEIEPLLYFLSDDFVPAV